MPSQSHDTSDEQTHQWPFWLRAVVSALILFHLLAVFICPLSDPPPASQLSRLVAGYLRPYTQTLSINNGYRFFAPDPGPGHLIRYEILSDTAMIAEGRFPDKSEHWPRLLYHRHFMISEMTAQIAASVPPLPEDVPPERIMNRREFATYQMERAKARLIQQSLANFFLRQYPESTSVRLFVQTHAIPTPIDLDKGVKLTDERLYSEIALGEFRRSAEELPR